MLVCALANVQRDRNSLIDHVQRDTIKSQPKQRTSQKHYLSKSNESAGLARRFIDVPKPERKHHA